MELDKKNLSIRPFNLTDVDDLMLWACDDQVMQSIKWDTLTSQEEALTFITELCIPHPWCRSICINNRSVGFISVDPGSADERCKADLRYAVARRHWGEGLATRAMKMAIPQVFESFPEVVRLQGLIRVENLASQRVLEKLGFQKEGVLRQYRYRKGMIRDLVMFSFLSNDQFPVSCSGSDADGGI